MTRVPHNTDNYGSQFHTIQPAPAQTTTDPNLYRLLSVIQADQQKHEKITKNATDKIENLQHSIANNHNPNGPQTYRPPQFAEQTQNSNANAPHVPAPWELLPPEIQNMRISREQQQNAHGNGQQRPRSQSYRPRRNSNSRYGTRNPNKPDAPETDGKYNPKAYCRTCGQHGHTMAACNVGPKNIPRRGEQIPVPVLPKEGTASAAQASKN